MKELKEIREIKEGGYIVIDDEPCTVVSVAHSKTGKHGSAKARIEAIGIFDSQKRSIVQPVDAKVYVPIVERKIAQVISVAGDHVQLMDLNDYSTFELPVPDELKGKLQAGQEVFYIKSMGKAKLDVRVGEK